MYSYDVCDSLVDRPCRLQNLQTLPLEKVPSENAKEPAAKGTRGKGGKGGKTVDENKKEREKKTVY